MKWEKVEIRNICKIKSGKRLPSGEDFSIAPTPFPYIRARDIKNGVISCDNFVFLTEKVRQKIKQYIVNTNDIVITIVGASVGDVGYVTKNLDGYNLTENAVRLTDFNKNVNPHYIFYVLNSEKYQKLMQKLAGGSAQAKLGIYKIEAIQLELPKKEIQDKIERDLSAYDDLIENNQKQIKLLEEAAQRLYKEWFVDLRFPGYETTPIIDGIPQGWKRLSAESFFNITIGKTPPRTESQCFTDMYKGIPWISISDMGESSTFIFETSEGLTNEAVEKYNVKIIPAGTILLSFKLTVGRVAIATANMCTNEAIAHFKLSNEQHREYVYCYLKNYHYDSLGSTSSISKAVNSKIIKAMPFVLPENDLIEKFSKITAPLFNQIFIKLKAILELKQARDRLLIKLMSGEIDVSQKRTKEMLSDKFDEIRKHWQKVRYNEELPLAARRTGDISEETLEKLKNIAEEE